MPMAGHIALVRMPNSDLSQGKNRPVLVLGQCPGKFDDWLICLISSRQYQATAGVDELVNPGDSDYPATGLVEPSVIRVCRLAVVEGSLLLGAIGSLGPDRLERVKASLTYWITNL